MADWMRNSPSLAHMRRNRRMALREQIDAEKCLQTIEDVEKELADNWKELTRSQVSALKLRIDAALSKLAKILPDVKAVEHDPGEFAEELTRERALERLTALLSGRAREADGGRAEGSAVPDVVPPATH